MTIKKCIFTLLAAVAACCGMAIDAAGQETAPVPADSTLNIVNVINSSGTITITEPAALTARLRYQGRPAAATPESGGEEITAGANGSGTVVATRNGYRIQIFDDNTPGSARARAEAHAAQAENLFPQWRTYITFNSPYWQVRVGDFKRRGEAEAAMAMIRDGMPSVSAYARIVAERINIIE